MNSLPAILIFAALSVFVLLPVVWAWRLVVFFFREPGADGEEREWPRAAVLLSLRGADPSLENCLQGLLHQDYPHYSIRIIIDNRDDPAWDMVAKILAREPTAAALVTVCVLEQRRDTCSLKVSAQIQAIKELDESFEVVALIDADVIPARNWLRSLVRPFADPRVGATTGVRWYAPPDTGWGTLVRYLWNAAANTQMYSFHIPWGGSLVFRARVLRDSDLLARWATSFCEDTGSYGVLRDLGLQLRFVAEAAVVNRESIALPNCCSFMRRQLLCARLHHAHWGKLLWANVATGFSLVATAGLCLTGILTGNVLWAFGCGGLLGAYGLGLLAALVALERRVRRVVRGRGEEAPAFPPTAKFLLAAPLTQVLHFACLFSALRLRRILWRGITYELESSGKVRLLEYRPYQQARTVSQATGSIL